jgi:tRNA pseudouridine38-40 synthase
VRTLKLTLEYDGGAYVGWQRQAEGVSIQGLLEEALHRIEGGPVTVHGAGRTDAGVHALGQTASFQLAHALDVDALRRALNATLPGDVRVTAVEEAPPGFHARFSARAKTYRYLIANAEFASPFERNYVWCIPHPLDAAAMADAAAAIAGTHDFAAFQNTGGAVESTVRTLLTSIVQVDDGGRSIVYEVTGDGFLRQMVRTIVGTLVEVGAGRRPAGSLLETVESRDRSRAGPTAPAQGLFLVAVHYDAM